MQRTFSRILEKWLINQKRKPLIVRGARQVGKTHCICEFGKQSRPEHFTSIDFRKSKNFQSVFRDSNSLRGAFQTLEVLLGTSLTKEGSLVFLDEIQDAPGGLPLLKYAEQELPGVSIMVAGSHLGLVSNEESYPVGCVQVESMFPLTFSEFIQARDPFTSDYFNDLNLLNLKSALPEAIHQKLIELHREYLFCGGMPEAVNTFLALQDSTVERNQAVRKVQGDLLQGFRGDFSKYSGTINSAHILDVFENMAMQLGRSLDEQVKKFSFSDTRVGARGFQSARGPLSWIAKARLGIKCKISNKSQIPVAAFTEDSKFKMYHFDTGLLNAMLQVPPGLISTQSLGTFKGYIIENFVAQELFAKFDQDLICWKEGRSELEFLVQAGNGIVPVEAKASAKARQSKSLRAYLDRYQDTEFAFKVTGQNFGKHPDGITRTLPIYLACLIADSCNC